MLLGRVTYKGTRGIALQARDGIRFTPEQRDLDCFLQSDGGLAAAGATAESGAGVDVAELQFLPPLSRAPKILCLGLNFTDHAAEAKMQVPEFPTIFARFNSCLVGHGAAIIKPEVSDQLDYEGEMVAVIGRRGKNIALRDALDHVAAYSVFNDASVRDYQLTTSQWTVGKNFDSTGAFGPWLVTPDEVPAGASGLRLETRLNNEVVQSASTADMILDVSHTIALLSKCMTLEVGDILVMGTPPGVGLARTPPLFMKAGDRVEVEIEGIGLLSNPIRAA
jgi:2-keto-4-pentenoate hydratase/2-oxohepta-3-ene-1,7-dioic acid hydratase in catechol pathway